MTLKEFQDKIKDKYTITRVQTRNQFIMHLGKAGTVILQYSNDKFVKFIVDGKQKDEIEKLLNE